MVSKNSTIQAIEQFVSTEMEGVCSAHDFFHIKRVMKLATKIQKLEGEGDIVAIQAGSLLHEALDEKFFKKSDKEHRKQHIQSFLASLGLDTKTTDGVMYIIENVGFSKGLERGDDFVGSKEFQVVEDADRLEAVGAIGIARVFAYGGKKKRPMYDPRVKPQLELDKEVYVKGENTSINHFYEKLLLLKDLMHTDSGRKIAQERHQFMEQYLEQFFKERNVEL